MAFLGSNVPEGHDDAGQVAARIQDIEWLSSLSESELDFLISLQELATRRAKNVGHKDLANKFDLRMLRAMGFVLMEFFKERLQKNSEISDSAEILRSLNQCRLSSLDRGGEPESPAETSNALSIATPKRKRMWDGLCGEPPNKQHKRQRMADVDR